MFSQTLSYQIFLILSINSYLFHTQNKTEYGNNIRRIIAPFSQNWRSEKGIKGSHNINHLPTGIRGRNAPVPY